MTNAASLYQGASINTATPAELTLMLYYGSFREPWTSNIR